MGVADTGPNPLILATEIVWGMGVAEVEGQRLVRSPRTAPSAQFAVL